MFILRNTKYLHALRRPCSDSRHVTAPYKLALYYYLLLLQAYSSNQQEKNNSGTVQSNNGTHITSHSARITNDFRVRLLYISSNSNGWPHASYGDAIAVLHMLDGMLFVDTVYVKSPVTDDLKWPSQVIVGPWRSARHVNIVSSCKWPRPDRPTSPTHCAVVTTSFRLRFDDRSTGVRGPFDCLWNDIMVVVT